MLMLNVNDIINTREVCLLDRVNKMVYLTGIYV